MKKRAILILLLLGGCLTVPAQKKTYTTTGGELIFSFANATINGVSAPNTVRFSPFFNLQTMVHHDITDRFGILTGFSIRNVGFIFDDPANPGTYYKTRSYTVGLPVGLKFGRTEGRFIYAGYEIEFPFHYKQKKFVNDEKVDTYEEWFTRRTPSFYHTLFVGIGLVEGTQLKFKYYLTNWFNKGYTAADGTQPYANFNANVFYLSLSFQILRGTHFYYKD